MEYCVGFLFNNDSVVLIRKDKPLWQKGKLNGVGGKVEEGESSEEAMKRETLEELGLEVDWKLYCCIHDVEFNLYVYKSFNGVGVLPFVNDVFERVLLVPLDKFNNMKADCLYNIHWLVHLALDDSVDVAVIKSGLKGEGGGILGWD